MPLRRRLIDEIVMPWLLTEIVERIRDEYLEMPGLPLT